MRYSNFRSSNPVFKRAMQGEFAQDYAVATYKGVALKTLLYLLLVVVGAVGGLALLVNYPQVGLPLLIGSFIGGFIASIVAIVSPRASKIAGSIYCLLQGFIVGIISILFEGLVPGVIVLTLLSTFAVLFVVATLYLGGVVRVTSKFVNILSIFAISVLFANLLFFIVGLISPGFKAAIYGNFGLSFVISFVMILLATLYLFFDLETIRVIVEEGSPKYLEWYASFGLVFTIIWLYVQLLPLIARVLSRSD